MKLRVKRGHTEPVTMPADPNCRPSFKTQTVKGNSYAYTPVDGHRVSLVLAYGKAS